MISPSSSPQLAVAMSTAATVLALVSVPSSHALLSSPTSPTSTPTPFCSVSRRPTFLRLRGGAGSGEEESALDRLTSRRKRITQAHNGRRKSSNPPKESSEIPPSSKPLSLSSSFADEMKRREQSHGGLEYLYSDSDEFSSSLTQSGNSRDPDELCHLLLLGSTFTQTPPQMSDSYAVTSCIEVLPTGDLSPAAARDAVSFAKHEGMSRLGTYTREECLRYGQELRERCEDFRCRVIPFTTTVTGTSALTSDGAGFSLN